MDTAHEREVIVRLYAAATGEGSWNRAMEAMGSLLDAPTIVLAARTPAAATRVTMIGGAGPGAGDLHAWTPLLEHALPGARGVARDGRHVLIVTVDRGAAHLVQLAATRDADGAPFGLDALGALGILRPHLQQALRTAARLERMEGMQAALAAVGDHLGKGLALLDACGAVIYTNPTLDGICAANDGLTMRGGLLSPSRASEHAVARLVDGVLRGEPGGCADVFRRSGGRPYSLQISAVPHALAPMGVATPRVAVIVSDPAMMHGPTEGTLSRRYGLTPAESRMVACLVGGATVSGTAAQLGVSLNTARTHLKRAMAKAGVSRQAELVRLLLSSQ